jgi:hypothetical protein
MTQSSSGTLAKYYKGGPVGIMPGQNMFVTDSTRTGLFDARSSFVRMLNIIFARNPVALERASAVALMDAQTPVQESLIWRVAPGTTQIEATPPNTMWDYQVFSLQERDSLLVDPAFVAEILAGGHPSVLVNGLGNQEGPQWSVYVASIPAGGPTPEHIAANPQEVFSIASGYDHHVTSFHDRDLLTQGSTPIAVGTRVLVDGVSTTSGFWTVWEFVGISSDADVDAAGFKLLRYQTYRTRDFWDYIDWYATGYIATNPPVVRYATAKARDLAENPNPTTTFVRVDDDGTGSWVWTAYTDGAWNVVARQNGTIAFSSSFYDDPSRPTIGLDPISANDLAKIGNRDGSWEFQVLFNLLQDAPALEPLEVNELFFSIMHFVHAQQDQVPWAFKTSFLNVGGYNEALTQTPVQPIDNTQNLLNYLDEVKPYRVKTREFTRLVTPQTDIANASSTDFDFPVYLDPTTGRYRNLDLTSALDMSIITTQSPWKEWFANYQNPISDPDLYIASGWNGVRHMNIGLNFDRVDHMPLLASQQFTFISDRPNPLGFVMAGIDPSIIDMREEIVEVFVNSTRLTDAQFTSDTDSVTIDVMPNDGDIVTINVKQNLTSGLAGDRIQRFYDPENAEAAEKNLEVLMGLQFKGNVMDGGSLGDNTNRDYDIDGNAPLSNAAEDVETINPNERYFGFADPELDAGRPQELVVTGTGESLKMVVQTNFNLGTPPESFRKFDTSNTATSAAVLYFGDILMQYNDGVAVFRDGVRAEEGTDYTVNLETNEVTVQLVANSVQVNEVIVKAFGISSYTSVEDLEVLEYTTGTPTFTLLKDVTPYVISITLNGEFLQSSDYTLTANSLTLANTPSQPSRIVLLAQGNPSVMGQPMGSKVFNETLTYNGSQIWTLTNPSKPFTDEDESSIIEVDGLRLLPTTDYSISNGVLHITKTVDANSRIAATTFSDKDQLGLETSIVNATVNGLYTFDSPFGLSYVWMTVNGVYHDPTIPAPKTLPTGQEKVVITNFRGQPLSRASWLISMNRPSTDLMAPKEVGDYDARPHDTTLYDVGRVGDTGIDPESETRDIFVIRSDAYEFVTWGVPDATLVGDLTPTSNTITVVPSTLGVMPFSLPVAEELSTNSAVTLSEFDASDHHRIITKPGVIWLNDERIEFFAYEIVGNTNVVLSELRRGTHNTRICTEQRHLVSYTADGSATAFALPGETVVNDLSVSVFEPLSYADGQPIRSDGYTGYSVLVPKFSSGQTNTLGTIQHDYTPTVVNGNLIATFAVPPPAGATVYLSTSKGLIHPNGSDVHDGRRKLDIRPDRVFGGETFYS